MNKDEELEKAEKTLINRLYYLHEKIETSKYDKEVEKSYIEKIKKEEQATEIVLEKLNKLRYGLNSILDSYERELGYTEKALITDLYNLSNGKY